MDGIHGPHKARRRRAGEMHTQEDSYTTECIYLRDMPTVVAAVDTASLERARESNGRDTGAGSTVVQSHLCFIHMQLVLLFCCRFPSHDAIMFPADKTNRLLHFFFSFQTLTCPCSAVAISDLKAVIMNLKWPTSAVEMNSFLCMNFHC